MAPRTFFDSQKQRYPDKSESQNSIPRAHFKPSQPAFTCSKLTIEILEQGVKYVQS